MPEADAVLRAALAAAYGEGLHERLADLLSASEPGRPRAALRAVLELHKPLPDDWGTMCSCWEQHGSHPLWPCKEVATILMVLAEEGAPMPDDQLSASLAEIRDPAQAGEVLYVGDNILCNAWFKDPEDEGLYTECTKPSRFCVSRSDGDESYGTGGGTEESCAEHLADAVCGMVDGDENVRAVVAIRWNRHEEVPDAG